jgi:uncharacterized protein with ParB-like and HNH nuclease domain
LTDLGVLPKAEPQSKAIKELVDGVRNGRIILPKFQRGFPTWSPEERLKLLDSIGRSYPMGSVLLWESHDRDLAAERQIGDIEVTAYTGKDPVQYVLDGQQRLGVICSAIFSPGVSPSGNWNIAYDLEKNAFVYLSKRAEPRSTRFV